VTNGNEFAFSPTVVNPDVLKLKKKIIFIILKGGGGDSLQDYNIFLKVFKI